MTKTKLLNIRLNPEKSVDKKILDYFDKSLVSKTALVKSALIHEIDRLSENGDPYVINDSSNVDSAAEAKEKKKENKERLQGGFDAFSNDI